MTQTTDPQIANKSKQHTNEDIAAQSSEEATEHHEFRAQNSTGPVWKRDGDIYLSGFIRVYFWLSQASAQCTVIIFCVFYLVIIGPSNDFALWLVVGCSIAGWISVTVLWFIGGIFFSKLFMVNYLPRDAGIAMTPLGSAQALPQCGHAGEA